MQVAMSTIIAGATTAAGQWLADISPAVILAVAMPLLGWIVFTVVGAVKKAKE